MKNSLKKIFSGKLYFEAMRQLRKIGLMSLVIFCIEALLNPLGEVIGRMNAYNSPLYASVVQVFEMHWMLVLLPVLIAPILTLYAYSFLNKRNCADFMHSIPFDRYCIFTSYFAAVASWMFIIGFGSTLVSMLTCLAFPSFLKVLAGNYILSFITMFTTSLYISAAIAFAMSITGTILNNVIVSGLVIFVPRFFLTVLCAIVMNIPFVSNSSFMWGLISNNHNILWAPIYEVIGVGENMKPISAMAASWRCALYMLAMAVILLIIGEICFKKRSSESANAPSVNKYLQAAYRIIITMIICIIPCYWIVGFITAKDAPSESDIFLIFVLYVIALIAYFLYELITTRKAKNLVKIIPGLAIVLLLNLVTIFGMVGIYNVELNTVPEAENVSSVSIDIRRGDSSTIYMGEEQYVKNVVSEVEITDKDIINILCDGLRSTVDSYKSGRAAYYKYIEPSYSVYIKFKCGLNTVLREVHIPKADYEKVMNAFYDNEQYKKLFDEIYTDIYNNAEKYLTSFYVQEAVLDEDTAVKLLKTRCEEMLSLDSKERMSIVGNGNAGGIIYSEMQVTICRDGVYYHVSLTIPPQLKKTYAILEESCGESLYELRKALAIESENAVPFDFYAEVSLPYGLGDADYYDKGWYSTMCSDDPKAYSDFARNVLQKCYDLDETYDGKYIVIRIMYYSGSTNYDSVEYIMPVKYYPELQKLFGSYSLLGEPLPDDIDKLMFE